MVTLSTTASALIGLADIITGNKSVDENLSNKIELAMTEGSITAIVKPFILEPTIYIDQTLRGHELLDSVIKSEIDIFIAFYANAANALMNMYNVEYSAIPTILSSGRMGEARSREEFGDGGFGIQSIESETLDLTPSTETEKRDDGFAHTVEARIKLKGHKDGKSFDISYGIIIVANIKYVDMQDLTKAVTKDKADDFFSRLDEFRSGAISFWNFLTGRDLIKAEKKRKLKDKEKILEEITDDENTSVHTAIKTGGYIGLGKYYRMFIINKDTVPYINNTMKTKLHKQEGADKFLESAKGMLFTIMDDDYETATIAINGLKSPSELTYRSLKKGKFDQSEQLNTMMKLLLANKI